MSKSALEALTRCLAKEERGYGIRVNAIAPGLVDTSMGRLVAKVVRGMDNIQELYPAAPFGRLAQPSDVGELCAFLVSESGSYISGQVIFVDAGVPASELLTS
jgi:NAD(P)-dependent dehydrogenase (short-subunit alcohol dehydrogenase family)